MGEGEGEEGEGGGRERGKEGAGGSRRETRSARRKEARRSFWRRCLLEEPSHPENAGQTLLRDVFGRAKLLLGKSPCLLPPRAPCFAPQAEAKGERAGLSHVWQVFAGCGWAVGADLRAARHGPFSRTARPEVGPYRRERPTSFAVGRRVHSPQGACLAHGFAFMPQPLRTAGRGWPALPEA